MDIVGFSRWRKHPGALMDHRFNLKQAIADTPLLHRMSCERQFLGDEVRLVFDATKVHHDEVVAFIKDVHFNLAKNENSETRVRAALVTGNIVVKEIKGCRYFVGPAVFRVERLQRLVESGETGVEDSIPGAERREGSYVIPCFTKPPNEVVRNPIPRRGYNHFVVATGHLPTAGSDDEELPNRLDDLAHLVGKAFENIDSNDLVVSVGPNTIIIAFPESEAERTKPYLDTVRGFATLYPKLNLRVSVTTGELQAISSAETGLNFEGEAAVAAARICNGLGSGALGIEGAAVFFFNTIGPLRAAEIPGKHKDERFECQIYDGWLSKPPSPRTSASDDEQRPREPVVPPESKSGKFDATHSTAAEEIWAATAASGDPAFHEFVCSVYPEAPLLQVAGHRNLPWTKSMREWRAVV